MTTLPVIIVDGDGDGTIYQPREWNFQPYTAIDETIAVANDTDFIQAFFTVSQPNPATQSTSFTLGTFPVDLNNVDSLSITVRSYGINRADDWIILSVKVVDPATGAVLAGGTYYDSTHIFRAMTGATGTPLQNDTITFATVDTSATKTQWDSAILVIRGAWSSVGAADFLPAARITAVEISGTYTASSSSPTPATILAVSATASALTLAPVITSADTVTVSDVTATVVAQALAPVVTSADTVTVSDVTATVSALALAPAIASADTVSISAVVATVAAQALAPVITSADTVTISSPAAAVSALALAPAITSAVTVTVSSIPCAISVQALAPVVTLAYAITVSAVTATAILQSLPSTVILPGDIIISVPASKVSVKGYVRYVRTHEYRGKVVTSGIVDLENDKNIRSLVAPEIKEHKTITSKTYR